MGHLKWYKWATATKVGMYAAKIRTGWWFGTFFIFPYIGNNHPNWLIFFRGVQTTNQFRFEPTTIIGLDPTKMPKVCPEWADNHVGSRWPDDFKSKQWSMGRVWFFFEAKKKTYGSMMIKMMDDLPKRWWKRWSSIIDQWWRDTPRHHWQHGWLTGWGASETGENGEGEDGDF